MESFYNVNGNKSVYGHEMEGIDSLSEWKGCALRIWIVEIAKVIDDVDCSGWSFFSDWN